MTARYARGVMTGAADATDAAPRIGIVVVAYNAATTLAWVLDRIPGSFRPRIAAILVSDDHSADDTEVVGLEYQRRKAGLPLTVVRQPRNLGYGGNQKFGYRWAIERGLDIVVLLHGDGQYAPELLADIVEPIVRGEAELVLGSRMVHRGHARDGGMPRYKYVGNRVLSRFQNALTGLSLSEWHSGYRALSVAALATIPFEANSDGCDFDTEILLQLHANGLRIAEVPIPTYYGDEICYVNGLAYARDVTSDVVRYRLARIGFGTPLPGTEAPEYEWKPDRGSSHTQLLERVSARPPGRVLDLGCGRGLLGAALRERGHQVVGVDVRDSPEAKERLDHFVVGDLEHGIPASVHEHGPYDVIVAADVLEHVRDPARLLVELRDVVAPGGVVLASVPNIGHWYPRVRVVSGRFDYDARGILDRDHVRFFTRRSFARLVERSRWRIADLTSTGLPFDVVERGGRAGAAARLRAAVGWLDRAGVRAWPTLFAYQFVVTLEPR
jgi:2-polyprenyl-3-methyl-5-hydroxy-6-metoxy-1,4-benzoquinol methylase